MRRAAALLIQLATALPAFAFQEHVAEAEQHHGGWVQTVAPWVNFIVLVGILVYLLRKPMADFLAQKRDAITKMLRDSEAARDEALRRMQELQAKVQSLESDLDVIKSNAGREAQAEKERLIAEAKDEARRIIEAAEKEAANHYQVAVRELKTFVVTEAVAQAEGVIKERLKDESHEKLINAYLENLSKN